jgi:hypothetical protein
VREEFEPMTGLLGWLITILDVISLEAFVPDAPSTPPRPWPQNNVSREMLRFFLRSPALEQNDEKLGGVRLAARKFRRGFPCVRSSNAPAAGGKARAGLSKEESARFFGPPPLIAGDDQAQYEAMRDQISAAVGPLDFLEEIWVNDVVSLVRETLRLRRLRPALLQAATPEGVEEGRGG